jgi:signal transduction histidine kinase
MATKNDLTILKELCHTMSALIIEDEIPLAESYRDIIGRFFGEVEMVHNAEEALAIHEPGRFSIIYTDLNLPGMSGVELIKNIKNYDQQQKFIVISASDDPDNLLGLLKLGISSFIVKPFTIDSFVKVTRDKASIITQENLLKKRASQLHEQLTEVTREKELQENILIQQSKLAQTGEMISMIAHQWRQPLSSITTIVATLRTRLELETYKRESDPYAALEKDLMDSFVRIEESAEFLSKTVNDFRNFYRPDNAAQSFNVLETIQSIIRMIAPDQNSLSIQIDAPKGESIMLHTFEGELKQVLINIINNAKDVFSEKEIDNPKINISLRQLNDSVYIDIIDNGGGIPEEILDEIFLPYFSTKSKKNGTGIGLHMAKTIIEHHMNGKLSASNNSLFGGANFTIKIPVKKETT